MLTAILTLTGVGLVAAIGLGIASRVFAVQVDPLVEQVAELVPGVNCGACGNASCNAYAEMLVAGTAGIDECTVMSDEARAKIAEILNIEFTKTDKPTAVVLCQGTTAHIQLKYHYDGVPSCRAAQLVAEGYTGCDYGCLGLGDCERVCPFDAIHVVDGLAVVDEEKCTACGKCVDVCPRNIIELHTTNQRVHVLCSSQDKGKIVRGVCDVGCIACRKCVKVCPVEAIEFKDNLARIITEKCIQCGACARACPTGSILDQGGPHYIAKINDNCTGCTLCARKCPAGAISGEKKLLHVVDEKKCVRCHVCYDVCNFEAIALVDEQGQEMIAPKPKKKKKKAAAPQGAAS